MKSILGSIGKNELSILSNVLNSYSTFVGIGVAIVYYISEIKKLTIFEGHFIGIIYIVVALIVLRIASKIILKNREEEDEN